MTRKIWLIIFLLGSLILLLGGMHHAERPDDVGDDPMVKDAQCAVANAVGGSQEEWKKAARDNPQWILQIESLED